MGDAVGGRRSTAALLRRRRLVVARPPSSLSSSSTGSSSSLAASRSLLHRLLRPKRRPVPLIGRFVAASIDEDDEEDDDHPEEPVSSQRLASARRGKRIQLQRFVPAQELVDEADFCLYMELSGATAGDLLSTTGELELESDHELEMEMELEPYEDAELKRLRTRRERATNRAAAIESAHTAVQLAVLLLRQAGARVSLYPLRSRDSEVVAHSRDDTRAYVLTIAAPTLPDNQTTHGKTSVKPSLPPLLQLADWVRRHPAFAQQVLPLRGAAQSQQLARLIATECPVERDVCLANGTRVLVGGQPLLHQLNQRPDMRVELFPLHRDDQRRSLVTRWRDDPTLALPLADIHAYFGPKIGMYFAWLTFYTKMLVPPTIMGVIVFVLGLLNAQSYCLHSFVLAIGTSVFVDRWRRHQREVEYLWQYQPPPASLVTLESLDAPRSQGQIPAASHASNCSHCDNSGYLETRAGFRAERMRDPVTRREVFGFPHHKRLFRQLLALPLLLIMCCVVGAYVVGLHMLSDQLRASYSDCYKSHDDAEATANDDGDDTSAVGMSGTLCGVITHGPGMLNALIIYLMDLLYQLLARKLNDFENYRTEAEYEDHLVIKRMPFHFVNSNASLWFLAFYVQSLDRVRDRLWILMVATQVIDNLKEVALPYVVSLVSQLRTATATATANHTRRRRRSVRRRSHRSRSRPRVKSVGQDDDTSSSESEGGDAVDDSGSPEKLRRHRRRRRSSVSDPTVRDRLARILTQRRQAQYADTFADYKELMVQYSYVTLYSPIFPLAPAFALLNNVIESRSDFVKLANSHGYQRPRAQHARGIGVWEKVLVSASVVAVVVNCALVYTYELSDLLPTWSALERFMFIVVRISA